MIKANFQMAWMVNHKMEDIIELYNCDPLFHWRQMKVQTSLFNLFEGTDPLEPVMGTLYPVVAVDVNKKMSKMRRKTILMPAIKPNMLNPFIEPKHNHYDDVQHLLPENTGIIDDILFVISRFNLINSPEFQA